MPYQIKVEYTTGDSFNSWETDEILEYEWESLEKAEEALNRIEEHYKWYRSNKNYSKTVEKAPYWHHTCPNFRGDPWNSLNLTLENGEEVFFWPSWIGYFEHLNSAYIIEKTKELPRKNF